MSYLSIISSLILSSVLSGAFKGILTFAHCSKKNITDSKTDAVKRMRIILFQKRFKEPLVAAPSTTRWQTSRFPRMPCCCYLLSFMWVQTFPGAVLNVSVGQTRPVRCCCPQKTKTPPTVLLFVASRWINWQEQLWWGWGGWWWCLCVEQDAGWMCVWGQMDGFEPSLQQEAEFKMFRLKNVCRRKLKNELYRNVTK